MDGRFGQTQRQIRWVPCREDTRMRYRGTLTFPDRDGGVVESCDPDRLVGLRIFAYHPHQFLISWGG